MLELELERTCVWPDYNAFIVNGKAIHQILNAPKALRIKKWPSLDGQKFFGDSEHERPAPRVGRAFRCC